MSKRRLAALRSALTAPLGPHINAETMASIVTAEAAGEDVDAAYAQALSHVERCDSCATAYDKLAQMMFGVLSEMSAAAAATPPEEVYASLLAQQLLREGLPPPQAQALSQQLASRLPLILNAAPHREDIDADLLHAALAQSDRPDASSQTLLPALGQAVQETLSALRLYLQGKAAAIWGREVSVHSYSSAGVNWSRLQLALLPALREPMLGAESKTEWLLFHQRIGHPLPIIVQARAERLTALSCRVLLHADRPGQPDASGRAVRLTFGSTTMTAQTDASGVARFEPLPIAALATLEIEVASG